MGHCSPLARMWKPQDKWETEVVYMLSVRRGRQFLSTNVVQTTQIKITEPFLDNLIFASSDITVNGDISKIYHSDMKALQLLLSTEKKMHNLKVENYILFSGHTEDLSLGHSLSDSSEGLFQWGKGGARVCRFLHNKQTNKQKTPGSWNIKTLLLIKENQTSPVNEFSPLLCMERCKNLDLLKSFLWYTP